MQHEEKRDAVKQDSRADGTSKPAVRAVISSKGRSAK
jgi:hypothetical protein